MTDYPHGEGKPDCPDCKGRGVVIVDDSGREPAFIACNCTLVDRLKANLQRGWQTCLSGTKIPDSPLKGRAQESIRITVDSVDTLRSHIKHTMLRVPPSFYFRVVTDIDLMDSWLSRDLDVADVDVHLSRKKRGTSVMPTLADLAEPPDLLIVATGIKVTRNAASPECLEETIRSRTFLNKPTWVVDTTIRPIQRGVSYSVGVGNAMKGWEHVVLEGTGGRVVAAAPSATPQRASYVQVGIDTDPQPPSLSQEAVDGLNPAQRRLILKGRGGGDQ